MKKTYEIGVNCDFNFSITADIPAFETEQDNDEVYEATVKLIKQEMQKKNISQMTITSFGVWDEEGNFLFEFD